MKLKSVFAASLLASGVAFADSTEVATSYTLGVLPVTIAAGDTEAVICVPWIEAGVGTAQVAVSNLVKTAGLEKDDSLYWFDANGTQKFAQWTLLANNGPWTKVDGDPGDPDVEPWTQLLNRGDAVILKLASAPAAAKTIYVIGQVPESSGAATVFTASDDCTATEPEYALIASPNVSKNTIDLNTDVEWDGIADEDLLIVGYARNAGVLVEKHFVWDSGTKKWGKNSYSAEGKTFTPGATVSRGNGFYLKKCSPGVVSITWK